MWKTVVPAAAVPVAEAVIRRRIQRPAVAATFPLRVVRAQLRRAHNRGLRQQARAKAAGGSLRCRLCLLLRSRPWRPCRLPPERHGAADRHGPDARRRALADLIERWARGRSRTMCTCRGRSSRFSGTSSGTRPT
ncbi:MAG: hypothetical protein ACLUNO_10650 [Oscillospiraceae bacterium]